MHIRPILPSDIPQITTIAADAFAEDPLLSYIHPYLKDYPADWHAYMKRRVWTHILTPYTYGMVAVADDLNSSPPPATKEEITGYAFFTRRAPTSPSPSPSLCQEAWRTHPLSSPFSPVFSQMHSLTLSITERATEFLSLDRSVDLERQWAFRTASASASNDDFAPLAKTHYWHLRILAVSPRYQRRGVGGLLVRYGTDLAGREGVPVTLRASEIGCGCYTKEGFVGVGWCGRDEGGGRSRVMVWDGSGRFVDGKGWVREKEGRGVGVEDRVEVGEEEMEEVELKASK
ncbi:MAG: hypothetical protein M1828_001607 [Chrysothrix sp. TS-e1954]|nr:MAG: hypothetical protein M1828_001607 [Chrysothrix sp. TS-e1954]